MKVPRDRLTPNLDHKVVALGQRLALARRRRRITAETAAARSRCSRSTISRLENGDSRVSFNVVVRLLSIYGLLDDLDVVAKDDELGRKLQDAKLMQRRRRPG